MKWMTNSAAGIRMRFLFRGRWGFRRHAGWHGQVYSLARGFCIHEDHGQRSTIAHATQSSFERAAMKEDQMTFVLFTLGALLLSVVISGCQQQTAPSAS